VTVGLSESLPSVKAVQAMAATARSLMLGLYDLRNV
jgi:hypothetical protein